MTSFEKQELYAIEVIFSVVVKREDIAVKIVFIRHRVVEMMQSLHKTLNYTYVQRPEN